jgi:hypothetical protein
MVSYSLHSFRQSLGMTVGDGMGSGWHFVESERATWVGAGEAVGVTGCKRSFADVRLRIGEGDGSNRGVRLARVWGCGREGDRWLRGGVSLF